MEKVEYKSARRSRALIRSALLSLLGEKGIDEITITELSRRADVNRGTFYAHYRNVSEVLEDIQNDVAAQLADLFKDLDMARLYADSERILAECVNMIRKDPEFYKTLLSMDNGRGVLELWRGSVINYLESASFLSGLPISNNLSYRCAVSFVINGTVECIVDSLVGRNSIPLDALPRQLSRLITVALAPYMERIPPKGQQKKP